MSWWKIQREYLVEYMDDDGWRIQYHHELDQLQEKYVIKTKKICRHKIWILNGSTPMVANQPEKQITMLRWKNDKDGS